MLNRQLGSYTIVAPLGMGGMGEVYRAPTGPESLILESLILESANR